MQLQILLDEQYNNIGKPKYEQYDKENLYCIFSEAFQHVCNVTILPVSNTPLLILFNREQMIPMVFLLHMFLMKVAVSRIAITKRAPYVFLHHKVKLSVVSKGSPKVRKAA